MKLRMKTKACKEESRVRSVMGVVRGNYKFSETFQLRCWHSGRRILLILWMTDEVGGRPTTIHHLLQSGSESGDRLLPGKRPIFEASQSMAMNRRKFQVVVSLGVLLLAAAAVSCNGFFVDPVLQTITVTPATPGILVGGTQQMTATGIYDDGSQKNITGTSSWTSTDLTVASVTPSGGLVTGVGAGTASIQATNGIVSGSTSVTVSLTGVTSIVAAPSSQSVTVSSGLPFCLTATAQPGGQDISATATWTFTDPTNRTESGITKTTTTTCIGQAFQIGTLSPTAAPSVLGAVASAPGSGNTTVNSNKVIINLN